MMEINAETGPLVSAHSKGQRLWERIEIRKCFQASRKRCREKYAISVTTDNTTDSTFSTLVMFFVTGKHGLKMRGRSMAQSSQIKMHDYESAEKEKKQHMNCIHDLYPA